MKFQYAVSFRLEENNALFQTTGTGISLLAAVKDAASKLASTLNRDEDGDWYYVENVKLTGRLPF